MTALRQWWEGLAERERRILLWGGGVSAVLLLVFGMWLPLEEAIKREKARYQGLQTSLAEMRRQAAEVARLRQQGVGQSRSSSGQSLIAILEQQVTAAGLKNHLKRMQPDGDRRLQLQFQAVSFDALVTLLQRLANRHGLVIASFTITPVDKPGRVDARLVIERSD